MCGLTQFTTKGHIIRASLEAVCYQTRDILEAMARDCGKMSTETLSELRVDGKMAENNLLLQLQADLCGFSVGESWNAFSLCGLLSCMGSCCPLFQMNTV